MASLTPDQIRQLARMLRGSQPHNGAAKGTNHDPKTDPDDMPKREIAPKYLPTRLPVMTTIVAWLLIDRYRPPGWAYGAAGCFIALLWFGSIVTMCTTKWVHPKDV